MPPETLFWVFMCLGATLAIVAIAYRLGHTVGYQQAANLTLPRFELLESGCVEMTTDAAVIEEAAHVGQREEVVISQRV
jgi:hypothetical protein